MKKILIPLLLCLAFACKKKSHDDPAPQLTTPTNYWLEVSTLTGGPYKYVSVSVDTSVICDSTNLGHGAKYGGWMYAILITKNNVVKYNYVPNGGYLTLRVIENYGPNGHEATAHEYIKQNVTGSGTLDLSSLPK